MIEKSLFQALDYTILALALAASLIIGFYFACCGGKQKTTAEYFKGNMNIKLLPIVRVFTIILYAIKCKLFDNYVHVASFISSNMMLGIPAEVYHYGFDYWYTLLGSFIGGPIAIYGFLPVFYKLQITSINEYLQQRFSNTVRFCSSLMYIFSMIVLASFVTYAPVLALSQVTQNNYNVTGLSVWTSILTTTAIGTIYTTIATVVWTDVLQLLIFIAATLATIIKGAINVGGLSYIVDKNIEGNRLRAVSFSLDPKIRFTAWGLLIYSALKSMALYGVSQIQLQRYMCCPNNKAARKSVWLNVVCSVPISTIYCFIRLILYAMYWNCDPLTSQQIEKPDQVISLYKTVNIYYCCNIQYQLFPLFVMHIMSSVPGMPGLFVSGVYCAALSTTSSILNSLAAITLQDHIKPRWKNVSDKKATFISKCIAACYGLVCLVMIAAIMNLGTIIQSMQYLMGDNTGAILGLFFLGLMNPWANSKGTILGIVCGLGVSWWISVGAQIYRPPPTSLLSLATANCSDILGDWSLRIKPNTSTRDDIPDIYSISYLWILPIAFLITVFVGSLSSLFIGSNKNLNMKLLSPFVHCVMKKCFYKKYRELVDKYKSIPQLEEVNMSSIINEEKTGQLTTLKANKVLTKI
uniref:Sodium-dependent multivitamin transporter n=1 Tax=Strigamia maritima TaxID=126957 RepID=T1IVN8_STRMM